MSEVESALRQSDFDPNQPCKYYVKMSYDFVGQGLKEMTLNKGAIVGVTKEVCGWSIGVHKGECGLFPTSFATAIKYGEEKAFQIIINSYKRYKFRKGLENKNRVREIICIIQELLDTEKNYLYFLELMSDIYVSEFEKRIEAKKPIISSDDIKKIFGNLKQIKDLSKLLSNEADKQLKDKNSKAGNITKVLGVFVKHLPFLNFYSDYVKGYDSAIELVNELSKRNKEFEKNLRQAREDQRSKGLGLRDLLPKPMQRIFGYKNIFDRLEKLTPTDSCLYTMVKSLSSNMEKIVSRINESKRHFEMSQKVAENLSSLLVSWRKFMKEGRLRVILFEKEEWVDCYLASDIFVFSQPKKDPIIFYLVLTQIDDSNENKIILSTINNQTITLMFSDSMEKKEWCEMTKKNLDVEKKNCLKNFNVDNPTTEIIDWNNIIQQIKDQNIRISDTMKEYLSHKNSLSQFYETIDKYKEEIRTLINNITHAQEERKKLDSTIEEEKKINQLVKDQENLLGQIEKKRSMFTKLLYSDENSFKVLFGELDQRFLFEKQQFDAIQVSRTAISPQNPAKRLFNTEVILDQKTIDKLDQLAKDHGDEFNHIQAAIKQIDQQEVTYEILFQKQELDNANQYLQQRNKVLEETNEKLNNQVNKLSNHIISLEKKVTELLGKNDIAQFRNEVLTVLQEKDEMFSRINETTTNAIKEKVEKENRTEQLELEIENYKKQILELQKQIDEFKSKSKIPTTEETTPTKLTVKKLQTPFHERTPPLPKRSTELSQENSEQLKTLQDELAEKKTQNERLEKEFSVLTKELEKTREEKIQMRKDTLSKIEEINSYHNTHLLCHQTTNKLLVANLASTNGLLLELQQKVEKFHEKIADDFTNLAQKEHLLDQANITIEKMKFENMKLQYSIVGCKQIIEEEKKNRIIIEQEYEKLKVKERELNRFTLPETGKLRNKQLPEIPVNGEFSPVKCVTTQTKETEMMNKSSPHLISKNSTPKVLELETPPKKPLPPTSEFKQLPTKPNTPPSLISNSTTVQKSVQNTAPLAKTPTEESEEQINRRKSASVFVHNGGTGSNLIADLMQFHLKKQNNKL
ncbi:hypothetical protein ABK040_014681 [Willaertia magna]